MQAHDYFNVPLENIEAAIAHQSARRWPLNVRVPTRAEVETLPLTELHGMIRNWIYKSAIEIIPSRKQMTQVLELLRQRPDIDTMPALLAMCEQYSKLE